MHWNFRKDDITGGSITYTMSAYWLEQVTDVTLPEPLNPACCL
jgi:hypothetical protein